MSKRRVNQILTDGGVGDLICCLVAVDHNIKKNPDIDFQVWVPDYLSKFAEHVLPQGSTVRPFSKAEKEFDGSILGRTTQWFPHGHTPMRTHPVDYGFHTLADRHVYDLNDKNYLQVRSDEIDIKKYKLPDKFVCIVVTGAEPVKTLPARVINSIADEVISRGYTPLFMGRETAETGFKDFKVKATVVAVDFTKGINLVNKTSLLEAAGVMSKAAAVIGMDGGMIHLAGCTEAPIIAGYTLASPTHLAPIRKGSQIWNFRSVVPNEYIINRYFQTENSFYLHDYRKFPGWQKVVDSLTADKFIDHLDALL